MDHLTESNHQKLIFVVYFLIIYKNPSVRFWCYRVYNENFPIIRIANYTHDPLLVIVLITYKQWVIQYENNTGVAENYWFFFRQSAFRYYSYSCIITQRVFSAWQSIHEPMAAIHTGYCNSPLYTWTIEWCKSLVHGNPCYKYRLFMTGVNCVTNKLLPSSEAMRLVVKYTGKSLYVLLYPALKFFVSHDPTTKWQFHFLEFRLVFNTMET